MTNKVGMGRVKPARGGAITRLTIKYSACPLFFSFIWYREVVLELTNLTCISRLCGRDVS